MSQPTDTIMEAITQGLIEADVFIETATPDDLRDILSPEVIETIETVTKSAIQSADDKEPNMALDIDNDSEVVEDLKKQLEVVQETLATITAERDELIEKALEPEDDDQEVTIEKAFESLPEEIVSILKADREERDTLRAELAVEREARQDETYIAKAAEYGAVVDSPQDFGPVLRRIASFDSEAAALIEKTLEVAQERIAKSALFDEKGMTGEGQGGDTVAEVAQIAKAFQEKDPTLTPEVARAKVWETHPELYDEYQRDRQSAIRNQ